MTIVIKKHTKNSLIRRKKQGRLIQLHTRRQLYEAYLFKLIILKFVRLYYIQSYIYLRNYFPQEKFYESADKILTCHHQTR